MVATENKRYMLDSSGTCSTCTNKPAKSDVIKCASCKHIFHGLCPTSGDHDFICRMSFLKAWNGPSVKPNFRWYCDWCLTKMEEGEVSTMEERFEKLVNLVTDLSEEMKTLKSSLTIPLSTDKVQGPAQTSGSISVAHPTQENTSL